MSSWYKHEPAEFNEGVDGLGLAAAGAYIVTLNLIYQRGGPIPYDRLPGKLVLLTGCTKQAATGALAVLARKGKLVIDDQGMVHNPKARRVLSDRSSGGKNGGSSPKLDQSQGKASPELALSQPKASEVISGDNNDLEASRAHARGGDKIRSDETPPNPQQQTAMFEVGTRRHEVAIEVARILEIPGLPRDATLVDEWLALPEMNPDLSVYPVAQRAIARMKKEGKQIGSFRFIDKAVRDDLRRRDEETDRQIAAWKRMGHE